MDGWKMNFLLGWLIFRGELLVSGSVTFVFVMFSMCDHLSILASLTSPLASLTSPFASLTSPFASLTSPFASLTSPFFGGIFFGKFGAWNQRIGLHSPNTKRLNLKRLEPENTTKRKRRDIYKTINFWIQHVFFGGALDSQRFLPDLTKPDFQSIKSSMPPGVYFKMGCNHGVLAQVWTFQLGGLEGKTQKNTHNFLHRFVQHDFL